MDLRIASVSPNRQARECLAAVHVRMVYLTPITSRNPGEPYVQDLPLGFPIIDMCIVIWSGAKWI